MTTVPYPTLHVSFSINLQNIGIVLHAREHKHVLRRSIFSSNLSVIGKLAISNNEHTRIV